MHSTDFILGQVFLSQIGHPARHHSVRDKTQHLPQNIRRYDFGWRIISLVENGPLPRLTYTYTGLKDMPWLIYHKCLTRSQAYIDNHTGFWFALGTFQELI
jgi:hypothetical protein